MFGPDGSMASAAEVAAAAADVKRSLRQLKTAKALQITGRVGRQAKRMGRYQRNPAYGLVNDCPVFTQVPIARDPEETYVARLAALCDASATIDEEMLAASVCHLYRGTNGKWFAAKTEKMEIGKSSGWLRTAHPSNSPIGIPVEFSTAGGGWGEDAAMAVSVIRTDAEQAKEDAAEAKELADAVDTSPTTVAAAAAGAGAGAAAPPAPPAAEDDDEDDDEAPTIDAVLDATATEEAAADEAAALASAKEGTPQTLVFTECNNCKYTIDGPWVTKVNKYCSHHILILLYATL